MQRKCGMLAGLVVVKNLGIVWFFLLSVVQGGTVDVEITQVGSYNRSGGNLGKVLAFGKYTLAREETYWQGTNSVRGGLRVLDVSDPRRIKSVARYEAGSILDFIAHGTTIFLAEQPAWDGNKWVGGGVHIINASDPANLQRIGQFPWPRMEIILF
jgi:hypothetical protein